MTVQHSQIVKQCTKLQLTCVICVICVSTFSDNAYNAMVSNCNFVTFVYTCTV